MCMWNDLLRWCSKLHANWYANTYFNHNAETHFTQLIEKYNLQKNKMEEIAD